MMKFSTIILFMISFHAQANFNECKSIKVVQLKMDRHADNFKKAERNKNSIDINRLEIEKNNGEKKKEKLLISKYAHFLVEASKSCPEQVKLQEIQNGPAFLLEYSSGNIISDTINFHRDGSVVSWIRMTKNGDSKIVNL